MNFETRRAAGDKVLKFRMGVTGNDGMRNLRNIKSAKKSCGCIYRIKNWVASLNSCWYLKLSKMDMSVAWRDICTARANSFCESISFSDPPSRLHSVHWATQVQDNFNAGRAQGNLPPPCSGAWCYRNRRCSQCSKMGAECNQSVPWPEKSRPSMALFFTWCTTAGRSRLQVTLGTSSIEIILHLCRPMQNIECHLEEGGSRKFMARVLAKPFRAYSNCGFNT